MFFKPVECQCIIYYGIFVSIGEISSAMKRFKYNGDIEGFIFTNSLNFTRIGDINRSKEFIIGKEIDLYDKFLSMKLKFNDKGMYLQHMNGKIPNIKLSDTDELNIKKNLFKIGFLSQPEYMLIHSYKANRLE